MYINSWKWKITMTKEITEKKKANPLVYILGIPVGILILVIAINQWQKYQSYNNCLEVMGKYSHLYNVNQKEACLKILDN